MKIYTKKGDTGTTQLLGGKRVSKSYLRIDAYGTVDELNSWIGLIRDSNSDPHLLGILKEIQDRLFTTGALLASDPEKSTMNIPDLNESDVELLEKEIDKMNEVLPELKSFILPGGHPSNSMCHIARCVCRRAERLAVALQEAEEVNPLVIKYLNRLSDYLFVTSRKISFDTRSEEIIWQPRNQ
jgi:cob(I)alamin adenosyltransferase